MQCNYHLKCMVLTTPYSELLNVYTMQNRNIIVVIYATKNHSVKTKTCMGSIQQYNGSFKPLFRFVEFEFICYIYE